MIHETLNADYGEIQNQTKRHFDAAKLCPLKLKHKLQLRLRDHQSYISRRF